MSVIKKVIIPVAGLGTRMLPATKAIPKEMLPLVDRPLIQLIVDECVAAGIKEIILVTHSSKMQLKTILIKILSLNRHWTLKININCLMKLEQFVLLMFLLFR